MVAHSLLLSHPGTHHLALSEAMLKSRKTEMFLLLAFIHSFIEQIFPLVLLGKAKLYKAKPQPGEGLYLISGDEPCI